MFLVHDNGAEPAPPEMSAALASRLDDAGIAAMGPRQRAAQPVRIGRHQNEVYVVRHQAPGPHLDLGSVAIFGEQVAIQCIVGIAEEGARAAIATLGDMVRVAGNDDTGEAGHAPWCPRRDAMSIKCTVTEIRLANRDFSATGK